MGKEDWYDNQFKWPCGFVALAILAVLGLGIGVAWTQHGRTTS